MQFFGSSSQLTLQRKRSQASQPMGGVRRSPFSSTSTWLTRANKSTVGVWRDNYEWLPQPWPSSYPLQVLLSPAEAAGLHTGRMRLLRLRQNWLFLQLLAPAVQ